MCSSPSPQPYALSHGDCCAVFEPLSGAAYFSDGLALMRLDGADEVRGRLGGWRLGGWVNVHVCACMRARAVTDGQLGQALSGTAAGPIVTRLGGHCCNTAAGALLQVALVAGSHGEFGNEDGVGPAARFQVSYVCSRERVCARVCACARACACVQQKKRREIRSIAVYL